MLVTTREMLLEAKTKKYAVGAFNFENMEMAQAIVAAGEETGAPVILQTTPSTLSYASAELFFANAAALARAAKTPVAIHLDHGDSLELVSRCLRAGYTGVMIDASQKPLAQNIETTRFVVAEAKKFGVPVEAELGRVGGKEDDLEGEGGYTVPAEALEFVRKTGVDLLAIAIGTAHGVYKKEPVLNLALLSEIAPMLDLPLVLHGASGVPDEAVRQCVARGICKVNFATELRIAFTNGVREYLGKDAEVFDPKKYLAVGREKVKCLVAEKIRLCRGE